MHIRFSKLLIIHIVLFVNGLDNGLNPMALSGNLSEPDLPVDQRLGKSEHYCQLVKYTRHRFGRFPRTTKGHTVNQFRIHR